MTKELQYWKEKLGLQSWNIQLKTNADIDSEGLSVSSPLIKAARVVIANKSMKELENNVVIDEEQVLVHELLHILFSDIEDEIAENCEEKVYNIFHTHIDDLSKALVAAKRNCCPLELYKLL